MGTLSYQRANGPTLTQRSAIDLLIAGLNDAAVAEQLGLSRTTVTKWRLYDPTFQVALNDRRAQILAGATDTLRAVIPLALETIREQLRVGVHRDRLALDLLSRTGLLGTRAGAPAAADPFAVGPTTLEDLLDAEVRRHRARTAEQGDSDPFTDYDSPITPEERESAYQHLLTLASEAPDS